VPDSLQKPIFAARSQNSASKNQALTAHENTVFDFWQQNRTASHGAIPLLRARDGQDDKV
jgi:hypothetical protein